MPPIKRFRPFLLVAWLGHATHQAISAVFAYRLARPCHPSSIFGHFCLSSGSGEPPVKRFRPFLLIAWLGHATHQAFWAIFACRLARVSHPSSDFGRFCLSPGSVMPPIKRFRPFLLIAWLGHATHQAFSAVFAYRLANAPPPRGGVSGGGNVNRGPWPQKKPAFRWLFLVAPAGFEPATHGL